MNAGSTSSGNRTLSSAKAAKQDEFYTQLADIENELKHYREHLRGKVVLCNCDDPFESNFFKYFAGNFNFLGLKKLIATSYDGSPIAGQDVLFKEYDEGNGKREKPKAVAIELTEVRDETGDGATGIADVKLFLQHNPHTRTLLDASETYGGGDFRSPQCVEFLKQADIVVTNPPFSLFREYVAQLVEHCKQFLIIGPKNSVTYMEVFRLIMANKLWLGTGFAAGNAYFKIPPENARDFADGVYDANTGLVKFRNVGWFTNMDHERRHDDIPIFKKYSPEEYPAYDNFDAIEVGKTADIPADYDGAMGVPITFLDRYNPDQFDILGITTSTFGSSCKTYPRQIQVGKDGKQSEVTKLNDAPAMKVARPPAGKTHYIVNGQHFVLMYHRVLIKRKRAANPAIRAEPV